MSYQGQPPVQPAQFDEKDGSSLEKGGVNDYVVHHNDTGSRQYQFDAADLDRVQRRLKERHVQMIAVCHFNISHASPQTNTCFPLLDRWYYWYWFILGNGHCASERRTGGTIAWVHGNRVVVLHGHGTPSPLSLKLFD